MSEGLLAELGIGGEWNYGKQNANSSGIEGLKLKGRGEAAARLNTAAKF